MIKCILWDIDGTLIDFLASEAVAIRACFQKLGLGECTDEMLANYSEINVKHWKMLERGEKTKPEILVGRFKEFFEKYGLDISKAEAFNSEYQIRLSDHVAYMPQAEETLKALQGKVLQYGASNGTKIAQTRKMAKSGMDKLFDGAFISEDMGYEKPDVRFFEKAFSMMPAGIEKREILMVGDSLTSDIRGGNNFGIKTVWFNPKGVASDPEVRIDYEIQNIGEIFRILEEEKN